MTASSRYDVFIVGETIDLVVPCEAALDDGWHAWFNDQVTTRNTSHGLFPNSRAMQRRRLDALEIGEQQHLQVLILPKGDDVVVGTASLGSIDWRRRCAEFNMFLTQRANPAALLFPGLEAKARLTEHAFEVLGLERIWTEQPVALEFWQRYQVLLGYRPDGVLRQAFRRGHETQDLVATSILHADYEQLRTRRGGAYWPGKKRLLELMRSVPNRSLVEDVSRSIDRTVKRYLKSVTMA